MRREKSRLLTKGTAMKKFISVKTNFGVTKIKKIENCDLSIGREYEVKELLYPQDGGTLGVKVLPVVDRIGNFTEEEYKQYPIKGKINNEEIIGSENLDYEIRKALNLSTTSRLFSILSYMHPEFDNISFQEIGSKSKNKTEFSITHNGMYIGDGLTRNSPFDYHHQKLCVEGYPASLSVVSLDGVSNEVISTNLHVCARILNESNGGVHFPSDYKADTFHLINLNSLGNHFRAMLDHSWVNDEINSTRPFIQLIEECDLFKLYCAEHVWQVLNTGLNIPQNERGYVEFYGEEVGRDLFEKAKETWKKLNPESPEFPVIPYFEPLWQKSDIQNPSTSHDIGKGMYCNPQTTSDLVRDIVKIYSPWHQVGPSYSIALILGFLSTLSERLGLEQKELVSHISKPINLISKYYLKTVDMAVGEFKQKLIVDLVKISSTEESTLLNLLSASLADLTDGRSELTLERAYQDFEKEMDLIIEELRKVEPKFSLAELVNKYLAGEDHKKVVKYYNPPATIHKIVNNLVKCNPLVTFKTIGTVMDYRDVALADSSHTATPKPSTNTEKSAHP